MRLVLDTNVWLDWLVFDGTEVIALKQARRDNAVEFMIDAACFDEAARVLAYPEFSLDQGRIAACLAEIRRLSDFFADHSLAAALPRCTDPDDQKFLQLAAAAKADMLVTRDKALLKLGRRTRRTCGFSISAPRDWDSVRRLSQRSARHPPVAHVQCGSY